MPRAKGIQDECKGLTPSKINVSEITAEVQEKGIEKSKYFALSPFKSKLPVNFFLNRGNQTRYQKSSKYNITLCPDSKFPSTK